MGRDTILILGATARPAGVLALRAGLRPRAIDLFADRDLAAACPARAIPFDRFPAGLADLAADEPPGPWLYAGGPDNYPALVAQISRDRPLWGSGPAALAAARDPFALALRLRAAGLPCPAVRRPGAAAGRAVARQAARRGERARHPRRKPRPVGRPRDVRPGVHRRRQSRAGLFVADAAGCRLLSVSRQLIGEGWLHVGPFRYCGSVGPLPVGAAERAAWERLGTTVAGFAGLRGLFGIDAMVRDGVPWPVEVNPRYTASVEVFEYATGVPALALHRRAFDPAGDPQRVPRRPRSRPGPDWSARRCTSPRGGSPSRRTARGRRCWPDRRPWPSRRRSPTSRRSAR